MSFFDDLPLIILSIANNIKYLFFTLERIMEQKGLKYIVAVMLMFSVIKPALATVIYANTLPKNAKVLEWPKFISNPIDFAITDTLEANNLSVAFVNKVFNNPLEFSTALLTTLVGADTAASDNRLVTDCIKPSDILWPASDACDNLPYEKISFSNTCHYFERPVYNNPDTLNFRFWNSVVNHENWDTLLEKSKGPSDEEPEPAPVGLLGVGIVGLASLQQRNKNKSA